MELSEAFNDHFARVGPELANVFHAQLMTVHTLVIGLV
jgi:hypothetical protein